jgi:DNA replication protein DnaC
MNLQLARLHELTKELQLAGVETNATALAQQAAKEEWDYLQFLERILQSEQKPGINVNRLCLHVWLGFRH